MADNAPPANIWSPVHYQLLDFGKGRKLERFGSCVLDRLCPAAEGAAPQIPHLWSDATRRLPERNSTADQQPWEIEFQLPPRLLVPSLRFQLKQAPFGHVGVFPEQAANWRWLAKRVSDHPSPMPRALNLFAYTGGATLAMSAAGAAVVHVDSSSPAVAWAKKNAELSALADRPIRWIVEDAFAFVRRELRRGNGYDVIVLDPPSYGHGPTGKAWKLERCWSELLEDCAGLLQDNAQPYLLWTGHSSILGPNQIVQQLTKLNRSDNQLWISETGDSHLYDSSGRSLNAGYFVRAQASPAQRRAT